MEMVESFGSFLRARRAGLTPEQLGLPAGEKRRVAGLRREEVALLAGVSVDYYTRLEQGREDRPSESVVNALARVLLLDGDEDALHYFRMLALRPSRVSVRPRHVPVSPVINALISKWDDVPAYVLNRRCDVIASNPLGRALFAGYPHSTSLARFIFLDEGARGFYGDWQMMALATAASLRNSIGADPQDPDMIQLIGELSVSSAEFRKMWSKALVQRRTRGPVTIHHPLVGQLDLRWETLTLNGTPDYELKLYVPANEKTAEAVALLGSLAAGSSADVGEAAV
ncbi:helix-turn-helix transcriptional regulator [Micromonospora sp. WMMD961]|uniref:helix-turn-helix transcriptional regulator n=1 Tax=Micromonospora sp. WMMD961 TaxID=3016100 RepID=UPI002416A4F8|nr:helix-turn-helix transcriptional regulator [Micromonospora sp. WMMD961]MDG4782478.1 helix-turn-helix transcriptional regulator [Micromonospora sp. WMMD961]